MLPSMCLKPPLQNTVYGQGIQPWINVQYGDYTAIVFSTKIMNKICTQLYNLKWMKRELRWVPAWMK